VLRDFLENDENIRETRNDEERVVKKRVLPIMTTNSPLKLEFTLREYSAD